MEKTKTIFDIKKKTEIYDVETFDYIFYYR